MDVGGGSHLLHGGKVDAIGVTASMCAVGRGESGPSSPTLVNPTNGRTCPGPTSIGALLWNEIILPARSSRATWLRLHCLQDNLLRDVPSVMSESVADSHSQNLQITG